MKKKIFILALIILAGILISFLIFEYSTNSQKNIDSFNSAWNRVNDIYPFLEYKKIDWDSIYKKYLPRVKSANRKEFRQIIKEMLAELKDVHVYYCGAIIKDQRYPYISPRQKKDKNTVSKKVIKKHFNKLDKSVKGILYGITPENIGYICFNRFYTSLIDNLADVFKYFKDTKGMIVDIRSPRGGDYNTALAFVNYFVTTSLNKPGMFFSEKIKQDPFKPSESEFAYKKPVAVLINGITISAGEITTEMLRQLPAVTVIGTTTSGGGGCSSGHTPEVVGEYKLPNGMTIMIPTGHLKRYDGTHFEWNGVEPDIKVEQTEAEIEMNIDKQFEYAINYLNNQVSKLFKN